MAMNPHEKLSRRERQIMEIVYRLGRASVADVLDKLPDPPSYSAVRSLLRILEEKRHLRHEPDGRRFLYLPVVPRDKASNTALKGLLHNFFDGSRAKLITALFDDPESELTQPDLDVMTRMIDQARKEGR